MEARRRLVLKILLLMSVFCTLGTFMSLSDFNSQPLLMQSGSVPSGSGGNVANESLSNFDNEPNATDEGPLKRILFWNSFYVKPSYGIGVGRKPFLELGCPVSACSTTTDRQEFATADAVMFHTPQLRGRTMPRRLSREQIWIAYHKENPLRNFEELRGMSDLFNLTMTYLQSNETDVVSDIGAVIPSPSDIGFRLPDLTKKSKMAAWVVSDCGSHSTRFAYVTELSKYLDVDIFGGCTNRTCGTLDTDCFRFISNNYYFYLAFENGYCVDYVTEKLYRTLKYDIVPIVLGAGDYTTKAPANSYIDVRDFESPRHLAEYLETLVADPDSYLAYFSWKRTHVVAGKFWLKHQTFCRLCEVLNDPEYPYKSEFDFARYWSPESVCLEGEAERRAVHLPTHDNGTNQQYISQLLREN